MAATDKELEAQLLEAGNQLLEPPSTVDELLPLLDRVESCLSKVEQSPNKSMQAALLPSQKALVAEQLLRHSDPDVKVSVASCISEITRITAPDAPYDDDQMKDVFQLVVSSFENLDDKSSRSYTKRASILETVAKVRSCVVMLDLECDALIVDMFQHFLKAIRDYHPENVFSSMETIMTLVIEESEDISFELLSPLLASVKNDAEDILPISRKLGERVIENSATKLKPHLEQEVESNGISLGDYSKVVASICQETAGDTEQNEVHDDEDLEDKSTIRESSEEGVQVDKENSTAAVSSEQVDPAIDGSTKVIMNNGGTATGEDESSADVNSSKKEEQGEDTEEVKGPNTSSVAEPDILETDKAVDAKKIPEEGSDDKGDVSKAQPAVSPQADNEEETEALPGHKSGSEDAPSPPREDPDVEGAAPSENEKVLDNAPSALEKESTDVAPPSPSGSLPDETRPKKAGRHKKKDTSDKEATTVAEDESKKVIDGTSDSELKSSKRSGRKVSTRASNEKKSPVVVEAPRKESGTPSDSEVKQKSSKKVSTGNSKENKTSVVMDAPKKETSSTSDSEARQKSAKKVDGSNKTSDESPLKQPEDKKKGARSKASSRRSATKSLAMEVDKETPSTPKSKPTKDELPLEETPKTNSKRKRLSEKEKQSGVKEFDDTEIVGSKIKVWWPQDHTYYKGVVHSYDSGKKKHMVKYNDGDEEILNLIRQKWLYVESDSESEGEQEAEDSSQDDSSELPLKKKARNNRDGSTKKEKMDVSPKLGGGASSSKSKGRKTKSGRKQRDSSKSDGRSKGDTSKAVGNTGDDRVRKLKDQTPKSGSKSVDVTQKSSKSKNEDDSSTQRASIKSKPDTQKAGKSNQGTPKTTASTTPKGKSPLISGKANGKVKSGSKARDSEDMEEDSSDSEKAPERTKGKSTTSSKAQGSQTKSGKKRRRGTNS